VFANGEVQTMNSLLKALRHPKAAVRAAIALARGGWLKASFRLRFGRRVTIGHRFRAYGRLRVRGPGRVVIGNDFTSVRNIFKEPCIITHAASAEVAIGNGNLFGGTMISCVERVEIGNNNLLANVLILDSDIIPTEYLGQDVAGTPGASAPVRLGSNLWLGANSVVLKGVDLGSESVLGAGSVAMASAEPRSLLIGNPARRLKSTKESE
jgi:acetyltransferase-like isoleucine patch superfamily enzyme